MCIGVVIPKLLRRSCEKGTERNGRHSYIMRVVSVLLIAACKYFPSTLIGIDATVASGRTEASIGSWAIANEVAEDYIISWVGPARVWWLDPCL